MCGIAGYAGRGGRSEDRARALTRMCGAIRHRGPDDEGHLVTPRVALGMRRLSIIDVSGGMQPISNEDGSISVVFNGEIYNYRELRRALEIAGHDLRTHSDTETLVHLYEDAGEALVHRLRGMFAFAIWDDRRESLLLARDRLGIKPLYYWESPDGIVFASELRSMLVLDDFRPRLDPRAVALYLSFGYIPDPASVFAGVRKLPPGHTLTWTRSSGARVTRYWEPTRAELGNISEEDAVSELRRLFADAVGSHLESEVPLGAFLSGGVDSSSVVAQMTRQLARPVQTFSIGFDEAGFNEAPDAARVAQALGTEHTELVVRPDADALVEDIVRALDEPFADPSALPTFLVSQLARQQVTVSLSGDGGDELFGGYTRYFEILRRRELGSPIARQALAAIARHLPHLAPGRNRLLDLARGLRGQYAGTVASPLAPAEGGVARADLARSMGPFDRILDPWFDRAMERDFATQMTLVDMMTYLPGDILTKVDRMSMAVSLEARVPILDHPLVEFAASLPSELKFRDGSGKWLFRRAIEPLVPASVLAKPKQGFALPLQRWFRRELRHRVEYLRRADSPIREFVDGAALERVVSEHLVGRRDHNFMLWRLLVLDLWLQSLARGEIARPSEHAAAPLRAAAGAA
ncbi:MAG TPA: asparagine synthase (glutamine-hydrolyzing) [Gemmatimonadaceae bacterium]|nr:asparagine synthase (glutamine-hydrolyzing) [Gemmatimonadaceae bacterium]